MVRQLVIRSRLDGVATTAGDLLDHLESLEPAQRRAMLDAARAECGLESTADLDARQPAPLTLRPAPMAPTTRLVRRDNGAFTEEPLEEARFGIGPSGQFVDLTMAATDAARQRATEESTAAQREARDADRLVEAVAADERRRAEEERVRSELPEHLRGAA